MSWKAKHHEAYEARVLADIMTQLAQRIDLNGLPFSNEEMLILAQRSREFYRAFRSDEKREILTKYKAHLSAIHGEAQVEFVWDALVRINNEIGYEEK